MTDADPTKDALKEARLRAALAKAELAELELREAQRSEASRLARSENRREFKWTGGIDNASVAAAIEVLDMWSHRDPYEPIGLTLCSPGGDVIGGFALYDFLQELRRRGHGLTTTATGMAASMAAILLQAGDVRVIQPSAMVLVHEVSAAMSGRMTEVEIEVEMIRKLQNRALDILAERATVTRATIAKNWKKGDWWLTAEQAVKYGFADYVAGR